MKMTVKIWEQHVAAARQQKVSTKTYANQHDLSPSIFYYCQRKLQANANVRGVSRQIRPSQHTSKFVALRVASAHIVSTHCLVLVVNEEDHVVAEKRVPYDLAKIIGFIERAERIWQVSSLIGTD